MVARGKTVIFSTHQLDQAQRLCEDVAIIHRGALLVTGGVQAVRESIGVNILRLGVAGEERLDWVERHPGVELRRRHRDFIELQIPDEAVAQRILREALERGEAIERFEVTVPSLNDVFLTKVRDSGASVEDIERLRASTVRGEAVVA
jgi:ABC-2 type transport system ATP-binding protein